ncbi:MAG: hypothetical protein LBG90_02385, partial [Spirochaetaceae bacterium]|nr:hypothetical protein [Spirochaetaceae bacterium]
ASQLCKIDSLLEKIDAGSSRLLNDETAALRKQLAARKAALRENIDAVTAHSSEMARGGNAIAAARSLQREVNQMSGRDIYAYEALLNDMLKTKTAEHAETMRLRAAGTAVYDKTFSENLKSLEDEVLKGYIYLAWLDGGNAGKDFSELKEIAGQKMKASLESHISAEKKNILSGIEAEMREAKLDEQTIQNALKSDGGDETANIARIREKATAEIIGESIRKKTLKAVLDCIEKQGFIVDKKNIKHQKDSDEVVMVAQKASGETAEFRVMLNGKFIYKFHGYEGQACQEDIAPFMRDLEEVYGVKPAKIEEIWRNPDKLSTQHYQTQKHKENRR